MRATTDILKRYGMAQSQAGPPKSTMRFNPGVQLDASQVEDRRGQVSAPPPLNGTTTTGTIPQSGNDYDATTMALAHQFAAMLMQSLPQFQLPAVKRPTIRNRRG